MPVDEVTGVRYLEPIVYTRIPGAGWRVPEDERERWDDSEVVQASYRATAPTRGATQEAKPVQQLVVELEAWVDLDQVLERQLRNAYEAEPLRVTRAVATVIDGARNGRLRNPPGLLWRRLRDIVSPA